MIDVFKLMRNWFDFCFENPEKITPTHTALYFFCIEHCNRLGWKDKFGLPMEMAKDAIGIKNYRTYRRVFDDIVEWGFIDVIQKSKNQWSSTIVAIVQNTKANTKADASALTRAMQKHDQKHSQKQSNLTVCIDIPNTIIPNTKYKESACDEDVEKSSIEKREQVTRLMTYFNFNEQNHFNHLRTCTHFINTIASGGYLPQFISQFNAYTQYKAESGQIRHSFVKFLGSPDADYGDGGWNAENWVEKLATIIPSQTNSENYNAAEAVHRAAERLKSQLI